MNYKYCIATTVNKQKNKQKERKRTRFRQSICILFLWRIFKTPGGCSHASPSTCNSLHNLSQINCQGKGKIWYFEQILCFLEKKLCISTNFLVFGGKFAFQIHFFLVLWESNWFFGLPWTGMGSLPNKVIFTWWHWAMRWCCKLMSLEAAIWIESKTATTSKMRSSKDGATKQSLSLRPPQKFVPPMKLQRICATLLYWIGKSVQDFKSGKHSFSRLYGISNSWGSEKNRILTSEYWEWQCLVNWAVGSSDHHIPKWPSVPNFYNFCAKSLWSPEHRTTWSFGFDFGIFPDALP